MECFAGDGRLSCAVEANGISVITDDLATDGTELSDDSALARLKEVLSRNAESGKQIMMHMTPPCATLLFVSGARHVSSYEAAGHRTPSRPPD